MPDIYEDEDLDLEPEPEPAGTGIWTWITPRGPCSVCGSSLPGHRKCSGCWMLFGPGHLAIRQPDGTCDWCLWDSGRAERAKEIGSYSDIEEADWKLNREERNGT